MISSRTGSNPTNPKQDLSVSEDNHSSHEEREKNGRTELGDVAIAPRCDGLELGVRLAVRPARPRPRHVRRAERGARVVRVGAERGDLRRRERRYRRRGLSLAQRDRGGGGDVQQRGEEGSGTHGLQGEGGDHCRIELGTKQRKHKGRKCGDGGCAELLRAGAEKRALDRGIGAAQRDVVLYSWKTVSAPDVDRGCACICRGNREVSSAAGI